MLINRLKRTSYLMVLSLALPQLVQSMEPERSLQTSRLKMPLAETNACKMMLLHEAQVAAPLVKDVSGVIARFLNEVTMNLVLDGELIYTRKSDKQQFSFKISDLINTEGTLDLSRPEFENASKYLVITTDPKRFFEIKGKNKNKTVVLVSLRSSIEEHIATTASPFKVIISAWHEKVAPIGIFWRWGNWENLYWFDYLLDKNSNFISTNKLNILWNRYAKSHPYYRLNKHNHDKLYYGVDFQLSF